MAQTTANTCPMCKGAKGITNATGQAQVCPLCSGSGKLKTPGLKYQYSTMFTLLANAAAANQITITDADFRWMFALAVSTGAFTVQILDAKTNRQFINPGPQHSALVFGTAQLPFPVTPPYTFNKLGTITVQVTDISGAPNTIWIGFDGQELVDADAVQAS